MESDERNGKMVTPVLNRLKEIASAVMYAVEAGTLEEVFARIAAVSAELVNARYAALGIPDGQGGLRYFEVYGVSKDEIKRIGHPPRGRGLLGAIMSERHPLRLEDMASDPRAVGFPPHHPHMTSLLGVPIQLGAELYGILYLSDRNDGEPFSEEDQLLIETMAGYAALAIASSQLRAQESHLALLEERERIGMELHDGIIQSLYAIGMQIELMRTAETFQQDDLKKVMTDLDSVIEDIRDYIQDLTLKNYRQKTVRECLADAVARLHIPSNLAIEIDAPDEPMVFPPATFEAITFMAHEAISNVLRHANATNIRLTADQRDNCFTLRIADNGQGFVSGVQNHAGLGLRNLQRRARLHGGEVEVVSNPGLGTAVTISLPLHSI